MVPGSKHTAPADTLGTKHWSMGSISTVNFRLWLQGSYLDRELLDLGCLFQTFEEGEGYLRELGRVINMKLSTGLKLALLALGVLLLYSSATLRAQKTTTITVCPAGPPDCHFQKIQDAINVAIEGSTIQVKSGTYAENLTIIYKRLILQGDGKNQVTVQGTVALLFTKSVTMSGFTIKDGRTVYIENNSEKIELKDNAIIGMALEGIAGIYVSGASAPIIIQNNSISGGKNHGILLKGSGVPIQIINNQVTDNNGDGIRLETSQADIRGNTITSNIGFGVWADTKSQITGQNPSNVMCNWTGILDGGATFLQLKGFWIPTSIQEQGIGHADDVSAVAYSPYGCLLASGSWDSTVKVWDVAKGSEVRTLSEHRDAIKTVAFSPDGKLIASGSADNTIKLWKVVRLRDSVISSYQTLSSSDGHEGSVEAVAFSPCKERNSSGTCTQWDGLLASGSVDKTIKLWDVNTGKVKSTLTGHDGSVYSIAFGSDGKRLASGSADNTIRVWDIATGTEVLPPLSGHSGPVYSVVFSPDGKLLVSGSGDGTVKLWEVATGKIQKSFGHDRPVKTVAFSFDGRLLAAGSIGNTIKLWEVATGKELQFSSTPHNGDVNAVAFNPICKQTSATICTQWELASGSADKTVKVWKVEVK